LSSGGAKPLLQAGAAIETKMAKLPWYMKSKGTTIEFHWLWVLWQRIKVKWWLLVLKRP